jgi:hypothetical protein
LTITFNKYSFHKIPFRIIILVILCVSFIPLSASIELNVINNPSPGYLFMGPIGDYGKIMCYDNYLQPVYSSRYTDNESYYLVDVKMLSPDRLVGFSLPDNKWYFFDMSMKVIDSLVIPSGYDGDFHDIIRLPNGNHAVFATRYDTVDMSQIVPGGKSRAYVKNYFLFEFNSSNDIVFSWEAMDHFNITDATSDVDLKAQSINPFNCNSIYYDTDGNYIISTRFLDELTKINRSTGSIIWRLGGSSCKNNQFVFKNDTNSNYIGFSHQHDARRLSNGNLLLFDNGNLKSSQESRVVEYQISESNKTIRMVWQYKHNPAIYSNAMGNVQRLPNGNTLIGWGGNDGGYHTFLMTEVTSSGTTALEITGDRGLFRAFKFPYKIDYKTHEISQPGEYDFHDNSNSTNTRLQISELQGTGTLTIEKHRYKPYNITFDDQGGCLDFPYRWVLTQSGLNSFDGKIRVEIGLFKDISDYSKLRIYYRTTENVGIFNYLKTTYNINEGVIEANISHTGEYFVVYNDYNAPVHTSPKNDSIGVSIRPLLKWSVSTPNETYRIQISPDSTFQYAIFDSSNIKTNQAFPSNLTNMVLYFWRIKAYSSNCESDWSSPTSFTTIVGTPNLYEPVNGAKDEYVRQIFKWGRVDSADGYRIQINTSNNFNTPLHDITLNDVAENVIDNLGYYTNYYWRVSAIARGVRGRWSSTYSFRTEMQNVALSEPANESIGVDLNETLKWGTVLGAKSFILQIADDEEFQNVIINETGLTSAEYVLQGLHALTKYYWRVKAFNDESMNKWSNVWNFTTTFAPPDLQIPSNGFANQKIKGLLVWKPINQAVNYEVLLSMSPDYTDTVIYSITSKYNQQFTGLGFSTKYYWKVRANSKDSRSAWSNSYSFTTVNEDEIVAPDLHYPEHQSYEIAIEAKLTWHVTEFANSYEIHLSDEPDFNKNIRAYNGLLDTTLVVSGLNFNQTYYWRALIVHDGIKSAWSDKWEFTTKLEQPGVIAPADGSANLPVNPTFVWSKVDGAIMYDIDIAKDENFNLIIHQKENIYDTVYNQAVLESNTMYYWRIRAKNINNSSDLSSSATFKTTSTSINNEMKDDNEIMLYPNPARKFITINALSSEFHQISIFNLEGSLIFVKTFAHPINEYDVDLESFSPGYYLIKLTTANSSHIRKFSITK